jgi:predicted HD phosphohydrolase
MTEEKKAILHQGSQRSSPYPVSRLAPAFQAPELAEEIGRAESMLSARTSAKLRVIADQIKSLQAEARKVLDEARDEHALTHAECAFKRLPGKVYHLYQRPDGRRYFSMLSPEDWRGEPPHPYLASYRLEADYSWTPLEALDETDDTGDLVQQLLSIERLSAAGGKPR